MSIVFATQRVQGKATYTAAQTSACEHLVIVAEIDGAGFTGGFTALHVPTSRALQVGQWVGGLTPTMVEHAIGRVSHLDWSNPNQDIYRDPQGEHLQAWNTAVAYYRQETDHSIKARDVTAKWVIFHETCGCTEEQHEKHLEGQTAEWVKSLRGEPSDEDPPECGDTCEHWGLPPCDTEMYAWVAGTVEPGTPGAMPALEYRT